MKDKLTKTEKLNFYKLGVKTAIDYLSGRIKKEDIPTQHLQIKYFRDGLLEGVDIYYGSDEHEPI